MRPVSPGVWRKLSKNKSLRDAFVFGQLTACLSEQIYSLRRERGWSQAELARRASVSQSSISRAERRFALGGLSLNTAVSIARAMDLCFMARFLQLSEMQALPPGWIRLGGLRD